MNTVCELMEKYNREAVDAEIKERIEIMFRQKYTVEQIASIYSDVSIDVIKDIESSVLATL
ncbi:MAG: hypothetical protein IJ675_02710 [Pseudobutyrivibrio sp.]|nr:hypothetical protein [Pseudobutyrivibrio sp.]